MGHNKKTCQINPIKEEFINPFVSQQQLRDKEDILDDLREGELSKLVVDHFE